MLTNEICPEWIRDAAFLFLAALATWTCWYMSKGKGNKDILFILVPFESLILIVALLLYNPWGLLG